MVTKKVLIVLVIIVSLVLGELPWSYDKISLWATVNAGDLSEYQIKFLAENYKMVYIGKASKQGTEEHYYNTSSYLRKYASVDELQILMYFAADEVYCGDYKSVQSFCNNQSMWFKDDDGNVVTNNGNPYWDYTQTYVQQYFANTIASVMRTGIIDKNLSLNGFFGDGMTKNLAHIYKNVSPQRGQEWLNGMEQAMVKTKKLFNEINNEIYIIGNAIETYSYQAPDYGSQVLPFVDGVAHCHYAEYEGVVDEQQGVGKLNTTLLLWAFNLSQSIAKGDYGGPKALWIKTWVGPGTTPISGDGLTHGPSWPPKYGKTPDTVEEIQKAATEKLAYPLAIYLCGIYNKYTYFGYSWFWDIDDGWVPCPDDPTSCDCPSDFYKEFLNKLGEPKSNAIITDNFKCNRSFEYADVYVDISDNTSAIIDFHS